MDGNSTFANAIESYDNGRSTIVLMQTGITVHEEITIVCSRRWEKTCQRNEIGRIIIAEYFKTALLLIYKLELYLIQTIQ